jgi:hypothetical protein
MTSTVANTSSLNANLRDLRRSVAHDTSTRGLSEHISLETEPEVAAAPLRPQSHKIRSTYTLSSRLRGCSNQVSILDDHFLSVNCSRPDREAQTYIFDLRFANPKPVRVRKVSWLWLAISVLLTVAAVAGIWLSSSAPDFAWQSPVVLGSAVTLVAGLAALTMFVRCTTESLEFTSVHGNATLISITGGIGSARAGKKFFVDLIKSINAAKAARHQHKAQWLRDEMREHHRLKELGVLTEEQYEASKARILAAHA